MQYKVPQNIDMEDKIVGPFTMRQFIYLLIPGGIIYGWYNYLSTNYTDYTIEFALVAIPVGLIGLAFALLKINDRPFESFALSVIQFLSAAKQRKWTPGYAPEPVIVFDKPEDAQKANTVQKGGADLDSLSKVLEKSASELAQKAPAAKPAVSRQPSEKGSEQSVVNLSVKDVKGAAEKQQQAQAAAPKKGFLGILK